MLDIYMYNRKNTYEYLKYMFYIQNNCNQVINKVMYQGCEIILPNMYSWGDVREGKGEAEGGELQKSWYSPTSEIGSYEIAPNSLEYVF